MGKRTIPSHHKNIRVDTDTTEGRANTINEWEMTADSNVCFWKTEKTSEFPEIVMHVYNNYKFAVTAVMITLVTFAVRVVYVTDRSNWVTVHPDEVFQSIAVAHIEYYGYGFKTFEYSSHFDDVVLNDTTPYRQMELEAGLSALRSPLFPYFYVLVAKLTSLLGLTANPYLIFRLSHVSITSLLPLSVYVFTTKLFHSNYAGILAAILTASSNHLNVLGSHCFVHSFLSPFIFSAISLVAATANKKQGKEDAFPREITQRESYTDNNNNWCENPNKVMNIINKTTNHVIHPMTSYENLECRCTSYYGLFYFDTFIKKVSVHSTSLFTTKSLSQDLSKNFLAGFIAGITCYIRPDAILIHCVNLLMLFSITKHCKRVIISRGPIILFGIIISILIGVFLDTQFYGGFTVTPLNWFVLNIVQNISTTVFGKMDLWFYFTSFYSLDTILCGTCVLSFITYIAMLPFHRFDTHSEECNGSQRNNGLFSSLTQLMMSLSSLLAIYSLHGHKEIRFIHDVTVIICIFVALTILKVVSFINSEIARFRVKTAVFSMCVVISSLQLSQFLNHSSTTQWTFQHTPATQDTNACLEFVSNQPDVRGVFLESNIFLTGGMTLLHKDVPIFSRVMNGFAEFDLDARINTSKPRSLSSVITNSRTRSINTFTRVSNYVSQSNGEGILRVILEKQHYNYLVTTNRQPFLKMDFRVVFHSQNTLVLKRRDDPATELRISKIVERLALGANTTVLLHEGDVLFHTRRYEKAAVRFQHALALESSGPGTDAVSAYLPLHQCLKEIGQHQEATKVMKRCVDLYGKDSCWKPRRITRLGH